jgi:hypothetical protein
MGNSSLLALMMVEVEPRQIANWVLSFRLVICQLRLEHFVQEHEAGSFV